jgi:hypothetical protein
MIHTKRVIFMILPLLFVPLVYGMSSTPDACAVPPAPGWDSSKSCDSAGKYPIVGVEVTCCWRERVPGQILGEEYCQTCEYTANGWECTQKELQFLEQPPTPPTPSRLPPDVLGNLPTLEQVPTTPPPLFGRNVESIQPTENIVQPPPTTPTAPPIFGSNIPQGGFEVLQEPETPPMFGQVTPLTAENAPLGFFGQEPAQVTTPAPTPTPTPIPIPTPTESPQEDGSRPLTGGGVLQEPEEEEQSDEPEDDSQEGSDDGQDSAGPLN